MTILKYTLPLDILSAYQEASPGRKQYLDRMMLKYGGGGDSHIRLQFLPSHQTLHKYLWDCFWDFPYICEVPWGMGHSYP